MSFLNGNDDDRDIHPKVLLDDNKNSNKNNNKDQDEDNKDEDEENELLESLWDQGVETGIIVKWPGIPQPLHISTVLEENDLAPLFHGTQWAGTRVWKAAIVAIRYLYNRYQSNEFCPASSSSSSSLLLLELGCGLGIPGMVLHSLFPNLNVILTDEETLVPQLVKNLERNFPKDDRIVAKPLSWSPEYVSSILPIHAINGPSLDVCLNCDCIYEPLYGEQAWKALADTLIELAKQHPSICLVTSVERRMADAVEKFLERLEASPYIASPIECALVDDTDPHHRIEIYVTTGVTKSRPSANLTTGSSSGAESG